MRAAILAGLGAACQVLIFPPFGWTWLAWLAPLPVFLIVPAPRAGAAAAAVWLFGTLWALAVVAPWMAPALRALFDLSNAETAGLLFLVCQGGLPFALLGFLLQVGRPATPLGRVLFAPAAWVAVEYLRAHVPFGTPWALLGLSLAATPIVAQVADLGGAYAISFVAALTSAALAEWLIAGRGERRRALPAVALATAVVALAMVYGGWRRAAIHARMAGAPTARVALVHAEIPNRERRDPRFALAELERHLALGMPGEPLPDLVVWPENAVPILLEENPSLVARIAAQARRAPHLVGAPRVVAVDGQPALRASAFLIGPDGIVGVYDKHRLLPLAETMPSFGGGGMMLARGFTPGAGASVLTAGRLRLGPLVCYEFIFPELPRAAVRAGAELLVNISNDSWFQPGAGPRQHFLFGRLRAVELRRTLVRAANHGPTAVVLPDGSSPLETDGVTPGVETAEVPLLDGLTVYARVGDLWAWLCVGLTAVTVAATRRRRG
jgi:apolipoprotein N-acyltransferase